MAKVIKSGQAVPYSMYERETLDAMAPCFVGGEDSQGAGTEGAGTPVARAHAEAQRIMQEAYEEGLRRGIEAGRAEFQEQVATSAGALKTAAQAVKEAREAFLAALEPCVAELALAVAARILRREAQTDPELVLSMVRAGLKNLLDRERLTIRLNPQDEEVVREQKVTLLDQFDGVEEIEVVPDPSVSPGGCIVESDTTHLDGRLESQLQQVLDALLE